MHSENDPGTGYLAVRVTTARGAIPLEGARVQIRRLPESPSGAEQDLIRSAVTERDGKIPLVPLPAPPKEESLRPSDSKRKPYALYLLEVRLEGYHAQTYNGVPIFDGVIAVQTVDLIPLSEEEATDGFSSDGERFIEAPDANNL